MRIGGKECVSQFRMAHTSVLHYESESRFFFFALFFFFFFFFFSVVVGNEFARSRDAAAAFVLSFFISKHLKFEKHQSTTEMLISSVALLALLAVARADLLPTGNNPFFLETECDAINQPDQV